jgi:hypothetical protein
MMSTASPRKPTEAQVETAALEQLAETVKRFGEQVKKLSVETQAGRLFESLEVQIGELDRIQVQVKKSLDRYGLLNLKDQLAEYENLNKTIFTDYVSPKLADELKALGVNFVDTVGNMSIDIPDSRLLLEIRKVSENPFTERGRPLKSLAGEPSARVVRGLLDLGAPIKASTLIAETGVSRASVYRTLDYLESQRYIQRSSPGTVETIQIGDLVRETSPLFGFGVTGTSFGFIAPRGIEDVLSKLADKKANYALTGSAAAALLKPVTQTMQLMLYSQERDALAKELGLREVNTGGDVFINTPESDLVFQRTQTLDSLVCVSTAQIAIDLASGPGRNPQEAEALIELLERKSVGS